jgi:hypothetical protein
MSQSAGVVHAITQFTTERCAEPGSRTEAVRSRMNWRGYEEDGNRRRLDQLLGGTHDRFLIDAAARLRRSGGTTIEHVRFFPFSCILDTFVRALSATIGTSARW